MRIMLLITGLGMGGAETQVCALADEFSSKGHQVSIVSLTGSSVMRPKNLGVRIFSLGIEKTILGGFQALQKIREIIRRSPPDVIHAHMFHANMLARLLRILGEKCRIVCTAHSSNEGGRIRMACYRLTNQLSDFNTNVSDDAVMSFRRKGALGGRSMHVVPNGINMQFYRFDDRLRDEVRLEFSVGKRDFLFMAVGRLEEPKDYPNLLQAFSLVNNRWSGTRLIVVGDGSLRGYLAKLIEDLGLPHAVQLVGARRDVARLLNGADCYVLSSAWEGMPMSVMEAISNLRPVVVTDCGGTASLVNGNGILCKPKDSAALAVAMMDCIEMSDAERLDMARSAFDDLSRRFSIDAVANSWISVYGSAHG